MEKFFQEKINIRNLEFQQIFEKLLNQHLFTVEDLERWIRDVSEVFEKIEEVITGDYILFNAYNNNELYRTNYQYDREKVQPIIKKYREKIDQKIVQHPLLNHLDQNFYAEYIKSKKIQLALFREENIPLEVEEEKLQTQYYDITGNMTVEWEGMELTLPEMQIYLKNEERKVREQAWRLIQNRRLEDKEALDEIMDQLVVLRDRKAKNAGFPNFRDYMYQKYERVYTADETKEFHEAVERYVVPLKDAIERKKQEELGVGVFRPWDIDGTVKGEKPLKPFLRTEELVQGCTRILAKVDLSFADLLSQMRDRHTLDLETRKGKSPGGFCSYLPISKVPFIFMNAASVHDDVVTLLHESGHAVHDDLKKDLPLADYKQIPMEAAELASMSMELFTIDYWQEFYPNESDFKRAKREHLEGIISFLPWAIVVDKFQHWLYENPLHLRDERDKIFRDYALRLSHHYADWRGFEKELTTRWQAQLHIYEVPFYYIDYAIAQLGAIQMWQQFKKNPKEAIFNYKRALSLGSSKQLKEIYKRAGIRFDFSAEMLKGLVNFVGEELTKL